jgi:hypothetical protein
MLFKSSISVLLSVANFIILIRLPPVFGLKKPKLFVQDIQLICLQSLNINKIYT